MTPLPQRKKTAEEISQLREQLGVPAAIPISTKMETEMEPSLPARKKPTQPETIEFHKLIHSDGSKEPVPLAGYVKTAAASSSVTRPRPEIEIGEDYEKDQELDSQIPTRKRTALELDEMRHREMLRQLATEPPKNIKFMSCHPAGITAGYLLAGVGSTGFWVDFYPWSATITGSLLAMLLAGFIALRRPISRHHAGFITATAVLVAIFTSIHHFLHI